jgi:hypothetical protein
MARRGQNRDFRPLGASRLLGFTGPVFVGAETVVDVTFAVAQVRLANLARGGWLAGASGDAYGEWGRGLARVGPLGSAPGMSRLVDVRFRDVVTHERSAVMTLRWEALGPGERLFPVLDADITLAPHGESQTLLAITGAYRPPLGAIGAALDRALLHRVAAATVQGFVNRMGNAVADPASATVPEPAAGAPTWLRSPLAPGEA